MSPINLPVTKHKDMENYDLSNKEYKNVVLKKLRATRKHKQRI